MHASRPLALAAALLLAAAAPAHAAPSDYLADTPLELSASAGIDAFAAVMNAITHPATRPAGSSSTLRPALRARTMLYADDRFVWAQAELNPLAFQAPGLNVGHAELATGTTRFRNFLGDTMFGLTADATSAGVSVGPLLGSMINVPAGDTGNFYINYGVGWPVLNTGDLARIPAATFSVLRMTTGYGWRVAPRQRLSLELNLNTYREARNLINPALPTRSTAGMTSGNQLVLALSLGWAFAP